MLTFYAGVSKLQTAGPVQPAFWCGSAREVRTLSTFLNGWKNFKWEDKILIWKFFTAPCPKHAGVNKQTPGPPTTPFLKSPGRCGRLSSDFLPVRRVLLGRVTAKAFSVKRVTQEKWGDSIWAELESSVSANKPTSTKRRKRRENVKCSSVKTCFDCSFLVETKKDVPSHSFSGRAMKTSPEERGFWSKVRGSRLSTGQAPRHYLGRL